MPQKLKMACTFPGCPRLAQRNHRCEQHQRKPWRRKDGQPRWSGWTRQKVRGRIFARDGYQCRYCGRPAEVLEHVVNRARGGSDSDDNLVSACKACNLAKLQQEKRGNVTMVPRAIEENSESVTF